MFLTIMVVGLVGLAVMALPAFGRHAGGHLGAHHGPIAQLGHGAGHAAQLGHHAAPGHAAPSLAAPGHALATQAQQSTALVPAGLTRFLPSPRLVFSLLALYGAFANALLHAAHVAPLVAALVAVVPAALVERVLVTPLWRLVFRFQGQP